MNLTPQHKQILKIHEDGNWHCSTVIEFIRDQRKRISEMNNEDFNGQRYQFESKKCDGRCGKIHSSNLVMRRLVKVHPIAEKFLKDWAKPEVKNVLF